MGSNNKKHKKEISKKRRYHSTSRSRSHSPEVSLKHKREHKKHHRIKKRIDRYNKNQEGCESQDSDCIEVPQNSSGFRSGPSLLAFKNNEKDKSECSENSKGESLSIDETNKLRAKLGLKPLETSHSISADNKKISDDLGEFYHQPARNLSKTSEEKKLRDKIEEYKEKRALEKRLTSIKALAESDGEEDVISWVNKNRELQKQKEEAKKRASLLEEMDAAFGIGDIITEDLRIHKKKAYTTSHLKGMRVEHDVQEFQEGKDFVLTLKDHNVLDDEVDALVNVNILDNERYNKSNENKKQKLNQHGYNVYDDPLEPENRTLLAKYDDVINTDNNSTKKFYTIGDKIQNQRKIDLVRAKLSNKRMETLNLPELKLASEYFTPEELSFKKTRKKVRKIRCKSNVLKADDLLAMDARNNSLVKIMETRRDPKQELNSDILDTDDTMIVSETKVLKVDPEIDNEFELALSKARKLKRSEKPKCEPLNVEMQIEEIVPLTDGAIVLNATAEFCRSLGEIPTYGLAGNRDEEPNDLLKYENNLSPPHVESSTKESTWSTITDVTDITTPTITTAPILEDEPNIGWGVGGALKLAMSKGYLEKADQNRPSNSRFAHLQAKNYSIEDKNFGDDEKFGGRRERYSGPTSDFKEKEGFKPNVKLDYIDDDGHVLSAKEAFRYLSHKFHGKGPGKNKVEKRIKKNEQEGLMKKMSSTDTPLGTLGMLQAKQKETHSAFVVLSGNKHMQVISKNK